MFKKFFNKGAKKPADDKVKKLKQNLRIRKASKYASGLPFFIAADIFTTGGSLTGIYLVTAAVTGGYMRTSETKIQTWENKAGQKIESPAYAKRLLKLLESDIHEDLALQYKSKTLEDKKYYRGRVSRKLQEFSPLLDEVKIINPVSDNENEPYYFRLNHGKGEFSLIAFTDKPFEQALTHNEKLKKNPKKGFGL